MKNTIKNIVVIGGVAAGPKAASRVKRLLPEARVVMVEQDSFISYGGCGMPYFISGEVADEKQLRSTSFHMLRDEHFFREAKGVEVLTRTRATAIDRRQKTVAIINLDSGVPDTLPYDRLVLATGSEAIKPSVLGMDLDGVYVLGSLHQAIAIKEKISHGQAAQAVVIGGGAIGIEMAEAFTDLWEMDTTLIELMGQLLPRTLDFVMAAMLQRHLEEKGIRVGVAERLLAVEGKDGRAREVVTDKRRLATDIVLVAAGVRPRSDLAREAGLLVSPRGGIVVNQRLATSDPHIYAAGDCIETKHLVTGTGTHAPFGSLANRQGRIAADNIAGIPSTFGGVVGSFIMKAFERAVGATGLSLNAALAAGFDADSALVAPADRAHFFPGEAIVVMELVFDRKTRQALGLQAFGAMNDGVLARIDAAAAVIAKKGDIDELGCLEMAYAPPFAAAIDSLNAVAHVADNMAAGRLRKVTVEDFQAWMADADREPRWLALDIRHPKEAAACVEKFGGRWLAIPYIEIRRRFAELPTDRTLVILCDAGTRSYEVQVFLDSQRIKDSLVLSGGFNVLRRIGADWLP